MLGVTAITVLKPYSHNSSQAWFGSFSNESIIPPGLKSRDLKTLPPREVVTPGKFKDLGALQPSEVVTSGKCKDLEALPPKKVVTSGKFRDLKTLSPREVVTSGKCINQNS